MDTAAALASIVRLVDALARRQPRNRDVIRLQQIIHKLAAAITRPPRPPTLRRGAPGYWAAIKRRQRARQRSAAANEQAPPSP